MPKPSRYGKNNPKPDSIRVLEKDNKQLLAALRDSRDALKFKAEMDGNPSLVVGFDYSLSLRIRGKPSFVRNCIVLFKYPIDRKVVEDIIENAFIPKEKKEKS